MADKPPDANDTDPLADTHASDPDTSADAAPSTKKRAVHVGDVLGRYELVEEVGEGGMATVYRARDRELRREVAVKVLFPHLARRAEVVRRFQREARAAAVLEHRNILRIYDVGGGEPKMEAGGPAPTAGIDDPPYIVMELIRGRSLLGELEQKGPLLAEVVACIGALLAEALGAAHAAGIIHRDVKPANVMIASDGRVLLADFGVARLETEDSLVTKTGSLLGTPAYMSPEQASGDTATAKSDLYSLGATLYQLSTGALPYAGPPAKVLAQIAQGSLVSAVKRRSAVGPDLSRVIGQMMQSEPDARTASAAEVARELRAIAASAGFGEPADEAAAYFKDPEAFLRERTPRIVSAIVQAAKQSLGEAKLPRAMALADRASALAPEDPQVATLVDAVTAGGRSSRRKKLVLAGLAGAAVIGGGAFAATHLGSHTAALGIDARVIDARPIDARPVDAVPDAVLDGAVDAPRVDAGRVDAGRADARVRLDAVIAMAPIDAAPDAAVDAAVVIDAAPAPGTLVVHNDTWCELFVDGADKGRLGKQPISLAAGHHTVTCRQSGTGLEWTKPVDVPAGGKATLDGQLLGMVKVTFQIAASLDGTPHQAGDVVEVKVGTHTVVANGRTAYPSVAKACIVREPLDCYVP
ncbi:MAG TPA: serine/threonine-protein kinase [Kofleriaceae bacterium]|nr:serine/threonine-protein kinase [Kofleriaceae bacterium]